MKCCILNVLKICHQKLCYTITFGSVSYVVDAVLFFPLSVYFMKISLASPPSFQE